METPVQLTPDTLADNGFFDQRQWSKKTRNELALLHGYAGILQIKIFYQYPDAYFFTYQDTTRSEPIPSIPHDNVRLFTQMFIFHRSVTAKPSPVEMTKLYYPYSYCNADAFYLVPTPPPGLKFPPSYHPSLRQQLPPRDTFPSASGHIALIAVYTRRELSPFQSKFYELQARAEAMGNHFYPVIERVRKGRDVHELIDKASEEYYYLRRNFPAGLFTPANVLGPGRNHSADGQIWFFPANELDVAELFIAHDEQHYDAASELAHSTNLTELPQPFSAFSTNRSI